MTCEYLRLAIHKESDFWYGQFITNLFNVAWDLPTVGLIIYLHHQSFKPTVEQELQRGTEKSKD